MKRLLPPLIALLLLLVLWETLVFVLGPPRYLVPPPSAVLAAAWGQRQTLLLAAWTTMQAALAGFFLSASLGVAGGLMLAASRRLELALYPYAVFLQTVPIVAIAPLLVLWFGPGLRAVAVSAFIVSVFPVVTNTLAGVHSIDPALRDLFRLYRASRWATLVKLELPAAVPGIVTGLKVSAGLAVIGAIVGEFVAGFAEGAAGLGIVVLAAYRQLQTDLLFAAVLGAASLGLVLIGAVNGCGRLLLGRWHPMTREP